MTGIAVDQGAIVERYISLRAKRKELKDAFEVEDTKLVKAMTRIEHFFLKDMATNNTQSIRTEFGTAFKKGVVSVSVADWPATLGFIRKNDFWHMLTSSVSKSAIEEYRAEKNDLPPGLNWREEVVVQIRKAA